ncbi:MAG: D-glycero-alpha-D-manno-heptose-1,7-bisphosphate 7-phosphatase [Capsulimonadaceae bacterium]
MAVTAVFLDRDGILNVNLPGAYVRHPGELQIIPGVPAAVKRLNDAGIPVIVVSNQQGVGKGLMTAADVLVVEDHIRRQLHAETGAWLDRCYYCTDLAHTGSTRRKPEPGMLVEAAAEFGLDLNGAVMVGDSATDIAAGFAAGVAATLLVLSGATRAYQDGAMVPAPDHVFDDLGAAVDWILSQPRPPLERARALS